MSLRVGYRQFARVLRATRPASTASSPSAAQPAESHRIIESPFGSLQVPDETLPRYLWRKVAHLAKHPCITCATSGRSLTYGEVMAESERWAQAVLGPLGLKPGDTLALLLPNLPSFLTASQGALLAGLRVTFANPLYTHHELSRQFGDAGVKAIVTIPLLVSTAVDAAPDAKLVVLDVDGYEELASEEEDGYKWQQLLADADNIQLPTVDPAQVAILPYSSGTTGPPKGVMLTHRNLVANLAMFSSGPFKDHTPTSDEFQERALTVLPYFHIYGFNGILNAGFLYGIHTISMQRFTPDDYLASLKKFKPTTLFVVPSLLQFLTAYSEVTPEMLASVEYVVSGAAPATQSLLDKFRQRHNKPDLIVRQGYGMTESSPVTLMLDTAAPKHKELSVGRLLPGTTAKVVTPDGRSAGPGETGELLVRGEQIMLGYLNNQKATQETLDDEGWLHTGDVVYFDEEGYFYIVDRTKELIKVKGNQVSPTELENIIMEIPEVADCAVVGIPDERADEVPRAFVVLHPNKTVTEQDIKKYVEPKVVVYKKLAGGVRFLDKIPRNPSGKIMRQELKKLSESQ